MSEISSGALGALHDGELIELVSRQDSAALQVRLHNNALVTIRAAGVRAVLASGVLNYAVIDHVTVSKIDTDNEQTLMECIALSRHPVSETLIKGFVHQNDGEELMLMSIETSTFINIDIIASRFSIEGM